MSCASCGNSWCWLCGVSIKGYTHFEGNGCGATTFGARREPEEVNRADQNIHDFSVTGCIVKICEGISIGIMILFFGFLFAWIAPMVVLASPLLCIWYGIKHFCC